MIGPRLPTIATVALVLAIPTSPARAQTPETLPYEVVAALFGDGGELDITIGRLPDPMPFELPLPDDARVIASLRGRYGAGPVIAIAVPGGRRRAEDIMKERLVDAGWSTPQVHAPRGGFVGGSMQVPVGFCKADGFLYLNLFPFQGQTIIRIQHHDARYGSPCSSDTMGTPWDGAPAPTLTMPGGAFSRGGGSSMSGETIEFTTIVQSRNSLESLILHFAAELTEQGWSGSPPVIGPDAAIQRWERTGDSWRGYLTAVQLDDDSYTVQFGMTNMDRVR